MPSGFSNALQLFELSTFPAKKNSDSPHSHPFIYSRGNLNTKFSTMFLLSFPFLIFKSNGENWKFLELSRQQIRQKKLCSLNFQCTRKYANCVLHSVIMEPFVYFRIRQMIHWFVTKKLFDNFIMLVIAVSSISLASEDPVDEDSPRYLAILKGL